MNINEKIYRNVKALCKIYGKDMKEVETAVGKSSGYLSRKNTKVDVETLMKLAEIFEVTCEELMSSDFEHELAMKEAIEGLKSAVTKATQFLTVEGIMNVISPLLGMEDEDERAEG
jgi:transcriptional regulator with XRE-family HTH domain